MRDPDKPHAIIDAAIREALTALSDFKLYVTSIRRSEAAQKKGGRYSRAQDA